MEITEVRIFLKDSLDKKLKAYATVTFDNAFVVRNIKVIEGSSGLFIAMPSRKIKRQVCPKCAFKNELRSRYCSQCGGQLFLLTPGPEANVDAQSEHRDIAHPITQSFREYLQRRVLEAFQQESSKGQSSTF